jgi:hypothetical protein
MKAPGDMGCGREGEQARAAQRRLWRAQLDAVGGAQCWRKADSNSWSHFEKSRPSQDTRDGNGRPPQLRPRPDPVTPPFRAGDQNGDQRDGFVCRET